MGPWLHAVCALAIASIGVVDYLTGSEIGLSVLYLGPICLAAWLGGRRSGLVMCVLAASVWLASDAATRVYSHPSFAWWNGGVRLTMFMVVSLLVSRVRALNEELRQRCAETSAELSEEIRHHRLTCDRLMQTEQQFRILQVVRDAAVFLLDIRGNIASWNVGAEMLLGYDASQMIGRNYSCLWPPDDQSQSTAREAIQRALQGEVWESEGWRVRSDGSRFWAHVTLSAVRDSSGVVRALLKGIHDITARKRLEDQLLTHEETERRAIGRDLHDIVGQELTGLALFSKELEERLAARGLPEAELMAKIGRCAQRAQDQARRLAAGLCAMELEPGGLRDSLERLSLNAQEVFGIRCLVEYQGNEDLPGPLAGLHLYRIAQEAISNAVKHGKASQVRISLSMQGGRCTLRVEDNGIGLRDPSQADAGMGLAIMKYRARCIGGKLTFDRHCSHGTAVVCEVRIEAMPGSPAGALRGAEDGGRALQ